MGCLGLLETVEIKWLKTEIKKLKSNKFLLLSFPFGIWLTLQAQKEFPKNYYISGWKG